MITELPPDTPSTTPDVPTVATEVVPLLHVPPALPSASVNDEPEQIAPAPVIAGGFGFTVSRAVMKQPVGNV